ncbi:MAG: T9SS type A sorting domain-containing protein [Chitinophagales bacterium]
MKKLFSTLLVVLFLINNTNSQTPELVFNRTASYLSSSNGKIFFTYKDSVFVSNGTTSGTQLLYKIKGSDFTEFNGKTIFTALDDNNEYELWITNGTTPGTSLVKDINPTGEGYIEIISIFNNKLYFLGDDGVNGQELWVTDGTNAGTVMLKDINPGSGNGLDGSQSKIYNGKLYFSANNGVNDKELWATDGTTSGTVMVKDINPSGSSSPSNFGILNNKLYFRASDNTSGKELWVTDGTGAGTVLVKDINPGAGSSYLSNLIEYNGKLYFNVSASFNFSEPYNMWQSDGTSGGTVIYEDSTLGSYVYKGQLYFGKISGYVAPNYKYALWKTDGTPNGAVKINDLIGKSKESPSSYTEVGGKLYFLCNYDGPGGGANYLDNDLWITDGTTANTKLIKHTNGDTVNVYTSRTDMIEFQGSLFFTQKDNKLYKIAGTPTGIKNTTTKNFDISVYPNPVNSILNISTKETIKKINIYNSIGALVQTESQNIFSIVHLPAGIYHIQVQTEKGTETVQIVKE